MVFAARNGHRRKRTGEAARRAFLAADDRLPAAEGGRALLRKAFPEHWSFLLGELALYSFAVLLLTGVYLTLFFDPDMTQTAYEGAYEPLRGVRMSQAYASTLEISFDVRGGLLIRQTHHWAALVFLTAVGLHMLRIFFTGAFRRPREVNWLVGVTMFVLALAEGFSGYSLPDDLLSGTGLRIAQGIMLSIPLVGTYVSFFAFGGEYPGHEIVIRLFPVHVLLLPGLLLGLVVLHLLLVVRLKHTHWAGPGRSSRNVVGHPMFPQFAARSTGLFLLVSGVLVLMGALAQVNPVWSYGPYQPGQVSTAAQPDWYVGFLEGSLRLMPPFETTVLGHTVMWNVLLPAVVLPALLFLVLYLYPFAEKWVTGAKGEHHLCDRPRNRPVRTGLGAAGITFYGVLLAAGGNDVLAHTFDLSLNGLTWTFRTLLVVAPPLAFVVTKRFCLALRSRDAQRLTEGVETGAVRQTVEGTVQADHRPLSQRERYALAAQEQPRPLPSAQPADGRLRRLRARLSRWYAAPAAPLVLRRDAPGGAGDGERAERADRGDPAERGAEDRVSPPPPRTGR